MLTGTLKGKYNMRHTVIGYHRNGQPIFAIAGGDGSDASGTGATPGAGATPAQPAASGSPAGATPGAGTAGSPPAAAAQPTNPPATGGDGLSDAGRRAIEAERTAAREAAQRAQAAEAELQALREASQSESEKALNQARREAQAEERSKWQAHIRTAEVRSQLRGAGVTNEKTLELAAAAPAFSKLKVNDDGQVEDVAKAIDGFKADHPEFFATAPAGGASTPQGGQWGGAAGGGAEAQPGTFAEAVQQKLAKQQPR